MTDKIREAKTKLPEYHVWYQMKQRCYYITHPYYSRYGGRGITICNEWRQDFCKFLKDMGVKPFKNAQIDRINNNGNYEPSNCRWVTNLENNHNRGNHKLSAVKAKEIRELHGKMSLKDIAEKYNICVDTVVKVLSNKIWNDSKYKPSQQRGGPRNTKGGHYE